MRNYWLKFPMISNRLKIIFGLVSFLLIGTAQETPCQKNAQNVYEFLSAKLNFSRNEFSNLKNRKVVVKLLDTPLRREIAVFGILRIDVPRKYFTNYYKDGKDFIEIKNALQYGLFHNPPQLSDVKLLILDQSDVQAIKDCVPENCKIKMSAKSIAQFHCEIDWSAPDYQKQVQAFFHKKMILYVQSYLKGGNSAMTEYDDQKYPLRLVDEFEDLLKESPYLYVYAPDFHRYLRDYPKFDLPRVKDMIFWTKENNGTKRPVISIRHISIYQPEKEEFFDLLISSKQIYASHYFEAAFGLTALAEDPDDPETGFYLLYINRSRIDALRHPHFGGVLRTKIRKGLNHLVEEKLKTVRTNIEEKYQSGRTE